jgi:hypothetical protein
MHSGPGVAGKNCSGHASMQLAVLPFRATYMLTLATPEPLFWMKHCQSRSMLKPGDSATMSKLAT